MLQLSSDLFLVKALDQASGTVDRNGAGLDMSNFETVFMLVNMGTIAGGAVTSIKAQQSDDDGVGDAYSDLLATKIDIEDDDDNQIFAIEITRPQKKFVRVVVDKDGANATDETATYLQYKKRTPGADINVTDLVTFESHVSPIEGVA